MDAKNYCPVVNNIVLALGIACVLYYFMCGLFVRFGQSMLWVWPVAGAVLIARYFLAKAGIIVTKDNGVVSASSVVINWDKYRAEMN